MPVLPSKTELPRLVRQPHRFARAYWLALLILFVGAVADGVTSWRNARRFGPSIETHIVQRWVQELAGVNAGVWLAKLIQFGFVLFVAAWWRPWTPWLMILCGLLYAAAAVSNHFMLL